MNDGLTFEQDCAVQNLERATHDTKSFFEGKVSELKETFGLAYDFRGIEECQRVIDIIDEYKDTMKKRIFGGSYDK